MTVRIDRLAFVAFAALAQCGEKSAPSDLDLVGTGAKQEQESERKQEDPRKPRRTAFVIDLMQDLVFRKLRDNWTLSSPSAHVNVDKLRSAGVDLVFSALQIAPGQESKKSLNSAIQANRELVAATGGAMEVVTSFKAAKNARERGVISVMLLMEGADVLEELVQSLPELKKQGLAVIGVVAGKDNAFAGSSETTRKNGGLTDKGRELLEACRDSEIAVDVTHASNRAFWDILVEQSGAVIASHTAARALREHARNLDDLQILALARYGGVMGLVFNPDFIKPGAQAGIQLNDVVDHVMHLKELDSLAALGLGTDFGGVIPPRGLEDISKLPAFAGALRQQGLSDAEIDGIMGENAAGFFEEMERDRGEVGFAAGELIRPIPLECDAVIGEFEGAAAPACNNYLTDRGPALPPASRQKFRMKEMSLEPVRLELFGEPGTPWQVEGQSLEGRILFTRAIALDEKGHGELLLPSGRNLARLFCSPTRTSVLREAVVWGR